MKHVHAFPLLNDFTVDYNTNTAGSYVPLEGAQVLIRQLFTVRQGITDANGYFSTGKPYVAERDISFNGSGITTAYEAGR